MISAALMKELDTDVLKALDAASKVMNGEVSVRPRDERLSGGLIVLAAHCENLLMRVRALERERTVDRSFIDELQRHLPADYERQSRDKMKDRV